MIPETCIITRIECFQFDCELSDRMLPGHSDECHCGLLTITTNLGAWGLGEFQIPCGNLKGDFVQWAVVFQRIKGLTLADGLAYVHQKEAVWGEIRTHVISSALIDLAAKLEHASKGKKVESFLSDRTYLFDHSQAYISF
ncbi:hypothetical protein LOZ80_28255 [Paenibacillus sp. HWE-109]|uniref:hypothetical protein n=1 Tax=Paenibacillus sp. HWE-109 TaxID=1306526 RepID=UPI001EE08789|nr:hypothetical protein [Paenibacillus sp. HWE-109]UKS25456.1 hypothetical protein LOZ80_28255 [Paenibacillus sp. HWE-109]